MIKYIFTKRGNAVKLDTDTLEVSDVVSQYASLDRLYLVEDDCEIMIDDDTVSAKKGDIIVLFYNNRDLDKRYIIVKNKDWRKRIMKIREIEQKEKEEWAKKNAVKEACPDCNDECACESAN